MPKYQVNYLVPVEEVLEAGSAREIQDHVRDNQPDIKLLSIEVIEPKEKEPEAA